MVVVVVSSSGGGGERGFEGVEASSDDALTASLGGLGVVVSSPAAEVGSIGD